MRGKKIAFLTAKAFIDTITAFSSLACVALTLVATDASAKRRMPDTKQMIESPRETLRKSIFSDTTVPACIDLNRDAQAKAIIEDPLLGDMMTAMTKGLNERNADGMAALFHERLKVNPAALREVFATLERTLKTPFEVTVFKMFALNSPDGNPSPLKCGEEGMTLFPLYGHAFQVGIWFQIMGAGELGRIYVDAVPVKDKWELGVFHFQQWTHAQKDPHMWLKDAQDLAAQPNKHPAAWIKYDIASKLLNGGGYIMHPQREEAIKARDALMLRPRWEDEVRSLLKDRKIVYINTILARDGAGIVVREQLTKEMSGKEIDEACQSMGSALKKSPWFGELGGLKCSYTYDGETPEREGRVGGLYVPVKEFKESGTASPSPVTPATPAIPSPAATTPATGANPTQPGLPGATPAPASGTKDDHSAVPPPPSTPGPSSSVPVPASPAISNPPVAAPTAAPAAPSAVVSPAAPAKDSKASPVTPEAKK